MTHFESSESKCTVLVGWGLELGGEQANPYGFYPLRNAHQEKNSEAQRLQH